MRTKECAKGESRFLGFGKQTIAGFVMDDSEKRVRPFRGTWGEKCLRWSAGDVRPSVVAWPARIGTAGKVVAPLLLIAFAVIAPSIAESCSRAQGGEPGGLKRLPSVDDRRTVSMTQADAVRTNATAQPEATSQQGSDGRIPEALWRQRLVHPTNARLSSSTSVSGAVIQGGSAEDAGIPVTWESTGTEQSTLAQGALKRQVLARKVSAGILQTPDPSHLQPRSRAGAPPVVRSYSVTPQQQIAIATEAANKAQELALKGAIYGARQQARDALVAYAVAADIEGSRSGRDEQGVACDLVDSAFQALREAGDFVGRFGTVDEAACARMVMSHETPVLKSYAQNMTGHEAAGYYLDYARQNLAIALQNQPAASRVLVLLGQCEALCEENPETLRSGIQLCCFRAAIAVEPSDAELLVQFGNKCMGSGLISESQWAFERAVMLNGDSRAASALIEIYARTGNHAGVATMQARVAAGSQGRVSQDQTVFLMTPQQFAAISPPVQQGAQQVNSQHNAASPQAVQLQTAHRSTQPSRDLRPSNVGDSYAHSGLPRATAGQRGTGQFGAGRGEPSGVFSGQGTQRVVNAEPQGGPETENGFWGRVAGQLRWVFQ